MMNGLQNMQKKIITLDAPNGLFTSVLLASLCATLYKEILGALGELAVVVVSSRIKSTLRLLP
jgi:hypothetical protein